ncbi:phage tail protein [Clostridium beijerinckii]|uniref:phage tail protein n=1 Tax=Clostridium beijerinckii TaxID=1520 RepID=UPI001570FCDE|nr:phage tail protein [Clostridium beijerinckii]NRT72688.1 hypothetical protein [Clostridium beijerinckii]
MAENFYTMLTKLGRKKLSASAISGSKVNFKAIKVGDGNGSYYEPSEDQTSIVKEVWSGNISAISVDESNANWIVIETVIPAADGGFFIREAGIFDDAGDMIAIAKLSETYKPTISEGSTKDLVIKIVLEVSNASSIDLKIDPNVVVATKGDIQILQSKFQEISTKLSDISNQISNSTISAIDLNYGMNSVIKSTSKVSVSPEFTIKGKTLVNLLGKDGNCEDVSKWTTFQCTSTLDGTSKVFGNNAIKVTSTASNYGAIFKNVTNIDLTKYYCVSAYIKNGNAAKASFYATGNGTSPNAQLSTSITDTTKFNRVFVKLKPNDFGNNPTQLYFEFDVNGTNGQYGYIDGVMLEEITSTQYLDSSFQPSPYVDSYSCLQNPYIEVKNDNLIRNGNGEEGISWWSSPSNGETFNIVNGAFSYTATYAYNGIWQLIKVKPNTNYYLSGITSGNVVLQIVDINYAWLCDNRHTFNTGSLSEIKVMIRNNGTVGNGTAANIILIEGITAPSSYKSCRIERCVLETKLTSDDSITYDNGKVTGQIWWKHKTLYGKDYDWQYFSDGTGGKCIVIPRSSLLGLQIRNYSDVFVKYDGTILSAKTNFVLDAYDSGDYFYYNPKDTDTGWSESINPNNDEVKCFMNGWKALFSTNGRYVTWTSIVDGSLPSGGPSTKLASTYTSGSTSLVVENSSIFSVGDGLALVCDDGTVWGRTITAISSNTLTIAAITHSASIGTVVVKEDNGTTNTPLLNYCKNNVASGYEGYQLHYKLQNPEPTTDLNCHVKGDIPKFDVGDNYLYLDSGIILGEVANPVFNGASSYWINQSNSNTIAGILKNKAEDILVTYKNKVYNSSYWVKTIGDIINAYGNVYEGISNINFDSSATYTVDYKILATQAPQIGTINCSYGQDIASSINDIKEEITNKQTHDSILDSIVDLSLYEKKGLSLTWNWFKYGSTVYVGVFVPFSVVKKAKPIIILNSFSIFNAGVEYSSKFSINSLSVTTNGVSIGFFSVDSTVSSIASSGFYGSINITADCRGRI